MLNKVISSVCWRLRTPIQWFLQLLSKYCAMIICYSYALATILYLIKGQPEVLILISSNFFVTLWIVVHYLVQRNHGDGFENLTKDFNVDKIISVALDKVNFTKTNENQTT